MYTLEGLNEEYVKEIYKNVVSYSIKNYQNLPQGYKEMIEFKYNHALNLKDELGITDETTNEVEFLEEQMQKVAQIQEQNQPVIDVVSKQILQILRNEMKDDLSEIEKCEFIFDYITSTMKYSEDWYKYNSNVPTTSGYEFDFYNGVPLSKNYEGLLVTRQGTCEDIANLMIYLGRQLGVEIESESCYHHDNLHTINYIVVGDKRSYFDATSKIRGIKSKEECFLVSKEKLSENDKYDFKANYPDITLNKQLPRYDINEVIRKVNPLLPSINYIEYRKLEK